MSDCNPTGLNPLWSLLATGKAATNADETKMNSHHDERMPTMVAAMTRKTTLQMIGFLPVLLWQ